MECARFVFFSGCYLPGFSSRCVDSGSLQPLVVEISSFLDEKDCQHIIDKALPHIQKSAVKHMDHEPRRLPCIAFVEELTEHGGMISNKNLGRSYGSACCMHAIFVNLGCWKARCRVENQQHIFYAIWWLLLACSDLAFVIKMAKNDTTGSFPGFANPWKVVVRKIPYATLRMMFWEILTKESVPWH